MQMLLEIDDTIEVTPSLTNQPKKRKSRRSAPSSQSVHSTLISFGEEDYGEYGPWIATKKTDPDCLALSNRHYSRVSIGAPQFTRPGPNLVLRTQLGDAVWVSWYSKKRDDNFKDVMECTIFRNESRYLSSDLVKWAIYASIQKWGVPAEGFITFVKDSAVKSENPGANYLQAGFKKVGKTKTRKLTILQLMPEDIQIAIAEVSLIHYLLQVKDYIQLAIDNGEFYEALDLYREAHEAEQELRRKKSEKARRKGHKWDSFEPNEGPMDILYSMSPGWLPIEYYGLDAIRLALDDYFGALQSAED